MKLEAEELRVEGLKVEGSGLRARPSELLSDRCLRGGPRGLGD